MEHEKFKMTRSNEAQSEIKITLIEQFQKLQSNDVEGSNTSAEKTK